MKNSVKLVGLAVAVAVLSGTAYAQRDDRDRRDLEERVVRTAADISFRLNREARDLNYRELLEIDRLQAEIRRQMRPDSGGPGGPGGPGWGGRRMNVQGAVETRYSFSFDVTDLDQLMDQCRAWAGPTIFRAGAVSVDDIRMAVDFGPTQTVSTSGWWKSPNAVCIQLVDKARTMGVPAPRFARQMRVTAVAESTLDFDVSGFDRIDLNRACNEELGRLMVNKSVDDVTFIANYSAVMTRTTSGWWRTSAEICAEIMRTIQ